MDNLFLTLTLHELFICIKMKIGPNMYENSMHAFVFCVNPLPMKISRAEKSSHGQSSLIIIFMHGNFIFSSFYIFMHEIFMPRFC